jgi:hypothetical protein
VQIAASHVPLDASVKLVIYSENGADQPIDVPALQGPVENSTTSVSVTFPPGFSRGFVRATWAP